MIRKLTSHKSPLNTLFKVVSAFTIRWYVIGSSEILATRKFCPVKFVDLILLICTENDQKSFFMLHHLLSICHSLYALLTTHTTAFIEKEIKYYIGSRLVASNKKSQGMQNVGENCC